MSADNQPLNAEAVQFQVETAFGPIELRGRDTGKAVLLVLAGLYDTPRFGRPLQAEFPDLDVVIGHVPGAGAPPLAHPSVGVFGAAYSEALTNLFAGRPMAALGSSAGALIALAIRPGILKRLLLLEPPLQTAHLWPMRSLLREADLPGWEAVAWPLFGIDAARHEARDYLPLLATLQVPTVVLVGSEPLMPPREMSAPPSYVDEVTLGALRAHKSVELRMVQGAGHALRRRRETDEAIRHLAAWLASA